VALTKQICFNSRTDRVVCVQHACIKNIGKLQHSGLPISQAGNAGQPIVLFTNTINIDLMEVICK